MGTSAVRSRWQGILNALSLGSGGKKKGRKSRSRRRFSVEPLEERTLLSLSVWDGGGGDNLWTTAANWVGDLAPTSGADLCFEGAIRSTTQNDLTAGTSFSSIKFASDGFSLAGNSLTLTGSITVDSGATDSVISLGIALDGSIAVDVADTSLTISGVLSGSGSLTKNEAGTLVLAGNNTYGGGTTINNGVLQVGDAGTTGSLGSSSVTNWTSLVFDRTDDITVNNVISGLGKATQQGGGRLTLGGTNTYTGGTIINSGTLALGSGSALGPTSNGVHVNGSDAELDLNGHNLTVAAVVLGNGAIVNTGGAATLTSAQYDVMEGEISADLAGSGGLTKIGTGTVILSGANSYSGVTTVEAGTLQLNGSGAWNVVLNTQYGGADVQGGTMIFDYTGESSPGTTIKGLLTASYHGGAFDVGQFQSSTIDSLYSLGWLDNNVDQVAVVYTLCGDATLDRSVNISDLGLVGQNWNGINLIWNQADLTYDGNVNISDLGKVGQTWNMQLATPSLTLSGEETVDVGATYTLTLGEVTGIVAVSYTIDWGDGETETYTAAEIEASFGQVTHTYTSDGSRAISADLTDAAGVSYSGVGGKAATAKKVSKAPSISDFYVVNEYINWWTISGTCADYDDSVVGYVVTFGGVLAGYHLKAVVEYGGVFVLTVELPGLQQGTATAQTRDPHGVLSKFAMDWVVV